jgi:dynein heavy chain, axonemal
MAAMDKWQRIEYNIIDVDAAAQFGPDFRAFRGVMKELERRLCQVVMAAFEDCATMSATFKLLDSFEGLLEREVIAQVRARPTHAIHLPTCCSPR